MRVLVSHDYIAPKSDRWQAMLRDFDLGEPVGSGATPLQAIEDLFWHLDLDMDPTSVDIIWTD